MTVEQALEKKRKKEKESEFGSLVFYKKTKCMSQTIDESNILSI